MEHHWKVMEPSLSPKWITIPDWSIRSIISIPGYINIARVSLELFSGVCDGILIYFSLFSLFHVQQIGCYMGFCITACVIALVMFICYCAALDEFATIIRCYNNRTYNYNSYYHGYYTYYYDICSNSLTRSSASTAAGLGGCLLVCALVETVIAFTASIYCCNVVCCGAATSPSVSNKFKQRSIYNQLFL